MIISHRYKYVYIQLDRTASTSMAQELVRHYDGQEILFKHARYEDFMAQATPEEKTYFLFSGLRNPLDVAVSHYFHYTFAKKYPYDFATYFTAFLSKSICHEWKTVSFNHLDFVYRYENIQEDFSQILKKIGLKQVRPLPLFNKTPGKNHYLDYYPTSIQGLAQIILKKDMQDFGYDFPKNWRLPTTKELLLIAPILQTKFLLQKAFHTIIDHPRLYQTYYRL